MYLFLLPLLLGFASDWASAFTTAYSRRWGERRGQMITFLLRMVSGIPLWFIGLVVAIWTPAADLLRPGLVGAALGWILVLGGCAPMILGLLALRFSAALPAASDALVDHGIYAHIRHPIYAGMLLEFFGLALLSPKPTAILACALGLLWAYVQARLEELDLVQRIPAYRAYMQRVPRFVPRFPKKSRPASPGD
jgi:protein-S-isoprenylcysteine O-methyltransferase Ste14